MAYEKKEWKNRVVEKPMTFVATSNLDGTVTLQPKEGKVAEEGTPIDAENMNRIEQGISDIDKNLGVAQNAINEVKKNLDDSNTRLSESIKNSASNAQNGINELRNQLQQPTKIPTSQPALQEGSIWIS